MRNSAIIFTLFIVTGCGLLTPETVFIGKDYPEDNQQVAKICGDASDIFAIYFDDINSNVIAVDSRVVPAFEYEKRNFLGLRIVPPLRSYCLEVTNGEHKLTVLADRTRGVGMAWNVDYYYGECNVVTEADHVYITMPVRLDHFHDEITVHIKDKYQDETVSICQMDLVTEEKIFELVDDFVSKRK